MLLVAVFPAYVLESKAFNPADQPTNLLLKELISRVAAVVAPIFYAYQIVLHAAVALADLILACCLCSPGILFLYSALSTYYSCLNFVSALLEIPQKLIFGPHHVPNYYGNLERYDMIHFDWNTALT